MHLIEFINSYIIDLDQIYKIYAELKQYETKNNYSHNMVIHQPIFERNLIFREYLRNIENKVVYVTFSRVFKDQPKALEELKKVIFEDDAIQLIEADRTANHYVIHGINGKEWIIPIEGDSIRLKCMFNLLRSSKRLIGMTYSEIYPEADEGKKNIKSSGFSRKIYDELIKQKEACDEYLARKNNDIEKEQEIEFTLANIKAKLNEHSYHGRIKFEASSTREGVGKVQKYLKRILSDNKLPKELREFLRMNGLGEVKSNLFYFNK